jgi:hypothetical protein
MQAKTTLTLAEIQKVVRVVPRKPARDNTKETQKPAEVQPRETWPLGMSALSRGILR